MNREIKICAKIMVVIVLTIIFMSVIKQDVLQRSKKQPDGEYIKKEDIILLADTVSQISAFMPESISVPGFGQESNLPDDLRSGGPEEYLTYGDYITILKLAQQEFHGEKYGEYVYDEIYQEEFYLLKEHFYLFFDAWMKDMGLSNIIYQEKFSVLCKDKEELLLAADGLKYKFHTKEIGELSFTDASFYVLEMDNKKEFLTLVSKENTSFTLPFAWLMKKEQDLLTFFWMDNEIIYQAGEKELPLDDGFDKVVSLTFSQGNLIKAQAFTEKTSGELLRRNETELEIEGIGAVSLHPDLKLYKLHGTLQTGSINDLPIGYEFADFVMENGKVCAILLTAEANMDKIRVAIKNNLFSSLYHEEIILSCDSDGVFYYGTYEEPKELSLAAGEQLVIGDEKEYQNSDRMQFIPTAHSGKIEIHDLKRNKMPVCVRGSLEILCCEEGYVLINELYLEEYLYSVVPSEMPAAYPHEALKAQAVAARTYAYQYLKNPGYPQFGAHVDDSVSYQVYNNIEEHPASTKAVRETKGEMLFFGEESITPYYYSTSCGMGTDADVWGEGNAANFPYLTANGIGEEKDYNAEELTEEENFREWILSENEKDFEYEIPWYRWTYEGKALSPDDIFARLLERYQTSPNQILTKQKGGSFQSISPEKFRKIYAITEKKRNSGGVLHELEIETDKGTYLVMTEYSIRYVLAAGGEICLKNGEKSPCQTLLPSAYFVLDEWFEGDEVTGFTLYGGGYGHGVGMSQNGAKQMALKGYSYVDILQFFYRESVIKQLYE
ncbi:MAG: SpoIID/LytB domain-containing protein [Lachnospiraceae bacterium]|nr:SpoIID/LytB domain-containing protein [Lachnospiraceae bacterium]